MGQYIRAELFQILCSLLMNRQPFIFLDWNSTTPILPSVRKVMESTFDIFGNPSSIHLEGRKARKIIEDCRSSIGDDLEIGNGKLFFTSGATESAKLILRGKGIRSAGIEHSSVLKWTEPFLDIDQDYQVNSSSPDDSTIQLANSETGIIQKNFGSVYMTDATQFFPKIDFQFCSLEAKSAILSPHKFGGPKGVGGILAKESFDLDYIKSRGSQEEGIRAGTENIMGIAGFSEAVRMAKIMKYDGIWDKILELRNLLEIELKLRSSSSIIVGENVMRLPNTSCVLTPGWSGEKQVISLDLEGFGISFGSACSQSISQNSESLMALGYESKLANCAIRISIGPNTTKIEIEQFIDAWSKNFMKQCLYAA